jgi:hypothetical protein
MKSADNGGVQREGGLLASIYQKAIMNFLLLVLLLLLLPNKEQQNRGGPHARRNLLMSTHTSANKEPSLRGRNDNKNGGWTR